VLRIRDVSSRIRIFFILDPGSFIGRGMKNKKLPSVLLPMVSGASSVADPRSGMSYLFDFKDFFLKP
jgi:hypothetical protein